MSKGEREGGFGLEIRQGRQYVIKVDGVRVREVVNKRHYPIIGGDGFAEKLMFLRGK